MFIPARRHIGCQCSVARSAYGCMPGLREDFRRGCPEVNGPSGKNFAFRNTNWGTRKSQGLGQPINDIHVQIGNRYAVTLNWLTKHRNIERMVAHLGWSCDVNFSDR